MVSTQLLLNYIGESWQAFKAVRFLEVTNPANGEILAKVPFSLADDVNQAAKAVNIALDNWRSTHAPERIQFLFSLKDLNLSQSATMENGKILDEALGEVRRVKVVFERCPKEWSRKFLFQFIALLTH